MSGRTRRHLCHFFPFQFPQTKQWTLVGTDSLRIAISLARRPGSKRKEGTETRRRRSRDPGACVPASWSGAHSFWSGYAEERETQREREGSSRNRYPIWCFIPTFSRSPRDVASWVEWKTPFGLLPRSLCSLMTAAALGGTTFLISKCVQ
jgi:hypothetical protein